MGERFLGGVERGGELEGQPPIEGEGREVGEIGEDREGFGRADNGEGGEGGVGRGGEGSEGGVVVVRRLEVDRERLE